MTSKVDTIDASKTIFEAASMFFKTSRRRFPVLERNKLVGQITKLVAQLRGYDASDSYRINMTEKLLQKLYDMGLITTKASLSSCDKVNVSAFCRLVTSIAL